MNKYDNLSEANKMLEINKDFINDLIHYKCEWGSRKGGIISKLRARGFNYSLPLDSNILKYSYKDNFSNILEGFIIL